MREKEGQEIQRQNIQREKQRERERERGTKKRGNIKKKIEG